jgi:hypothetical protein
VQNCPVQTFNPDFLNGLGGLIGCFSSVNAYNCVTTTSLLGQQSGGIFGANCVFCIAANCIGGIIGVNVVDHCGGIFGSSSKGCTASYCKSYYTLSGDLCGGIFGSYSNNYNNAEPSYPCYANNSSSYGSLLGFDLVGGIFGPNCKSCIASKCFSIGQITSPNDYYGAGGIFGGFAIDCQAVYCYSLGDISFFGGGIFGSYVNGSTALYCYSLGNISSNSGGIFASNSLNCVSSNCYSYGSINDISNGIFSISSSNPSQTNCYVANNSWSNTDAFTFGITGEQWININPQFDNPYLLTAFNDNFYNNTTNTSVYINTWTHLTLSYYGNLFYIVPNSHNIYIKSDELNEHFGQVITNNSDIYNIYIIRTFSTNNLIDSTHLYGYNIINFVLSVIKKKQKNIINFDIYYLFKKKHKKHKKYIK